MTIVNTVYNWLKELGYNISKDYLKENLEKHPEYPSLLSITDTLDFLGIDNGAYMMDKNEQSGMVYPFLAHLPVNSGEFRIIYNEKGKRKQMPNEIKKWNGVAVFVERKEGWSSIENTQYTNKERSEKIEIFASIAIILITGILAANNAFFKWGIDSFIFIFSIGVMYKFFNYSKRTWNRK